MYATKSLSELKAIAAELNIVPTGDKRSKQSWINAIESHESMPELPTHAEQEAIAIAADMAMAVTTEVESMTESVTTESITSEVGVIDYGDIPQTIAEPELEPTIPARRGAATVVSVLVVMLIVAIRAIVIGGCALVQCGLYIVRLFGKYNPDLDLWHQPRLPVKSPQPSYT